MHLSITLPLAAATGKPEVLFGNQWLALGAILAGITVFILLVAAVGRWLAATHPDAPAPTPAPVAAAPSADEGISPQVFAAIAGAVYATLGKSARVVAANVAVEAELEDARHLWAAEGRRQIYSSHRLR
jgi:hypothetical protein